MFKLTLCGLKIFRSTYTNDNFSYGQGARKSSLPTSLTRSEGTPCRQQIFLVLSPVLVSVSPAAPADCQRVLVAEAAHLHPKCSRSYSKSEVSRIRHRQMSCRLQLERLGSHQTSAWLAGVWLEEVQCRLCSSR